MKRWHDILCGCALLVAGGFLANVGVSALPHGRVVGGNATWAVYFGGALLLAGSGVYLIFRARHAKLGP